MLAVLHSRDRVGTLRPAGRELEFAYGPEWLAGESHFALSPRLPLREEPWRGEEVLYFFANLLPEGHLLDTLCKLRKLPRGNVLRLLESFGRECAGAFEIVPEDEAKRPARRKPAYLPYSRADLAADLARLRDHVPLLQNHRELRLSLAGAQDKIPVRYTGDELFLSMDGAASTHILKPALQPQARFPDAVVNEAYCLRLAGALGLPVPQVIVLTDPEPVLLVERYDREVKGEHIERLHQLDMCQLNGYLPDQKYEGDGGPGFAECFARVDEYSTLPAADRLRLVDWLICNFLIGNADAHGKNLSMLYQTDGRLRLSPTYDLLSLGYWPELSDKMAMKVGGERRPAWVQARHWQRLCDKVGLNIVQLRRRASELSTRATNAAGALLESLDASPAFSRHIRKTLDQRSGWLARMSDAPR